jgi:hypothetical protein
MKISQTGVGSTSNSLHLTDRNGTGVLPLQTQVEGTATYRISARVSEDAPWAEIQPASTESNLESVSWIPQIQLEVTSGSGTVTLWVAET